MRNMRTIGCWLLLAASPFSILAHEGMWLPTLLKSIEGQMQQEGLELTAEQIYSVEKGSLKDAIVLFGGGCTAEVISDQGLILTNHHCGYGTIQRQSSLENDYLKHGFWAADRSAELMNPGLSVTFIVRMEDVTTEVLEKVRPEMTEAERSSGIELATENLVKLATEGSHYNATVKAFNYGNSYFLIVTETYEDVRLVGAPPSSIGKYGADTDNWVWPRHTGDFSMFRIYAGPDNMPAKPSPDNVPFKPRYVLPISLDGPQENGFAMIFGFPGSTQRYLPSFAVEHIITQQDPMRIRMREASLGVIDAAMRSSDELRLKYASRQSSIANAWKKWIGEELGLTRMNAVRIKRDQERLFNERIREKGLEARFGKVLGEMRGTFAELVPLSNSRDLFIEFGFYGPEAPGFASQYRELVEHYEELQENGELEATVEKLRSRIDGHFKDYDLAVDRDVFKALLPLYLRYMDPALAPSILVEADKRYRGDLDRFVEDLYARSMFVSKAGIEKNLMNMSRSTIKKIAKDPMYQVMEQVFDAYYESTRPRFVELYEAFELQMRNWTQGLQLAIPEARYWPDANSTLRLSYGRVEGSRPRDAVDYMPFTTLEGVMDKYVPGDHEFDLPARLIELYEQKDYGRYGNGGEMTVCFTSSLHTTGGNSGSPIINGKGQLIGLNFDRSWESTMSDVLFDPEICRNISVDIRYVLFIVDKFAGARHLVDEMQLVKAPEPAIVE